MLPLLHGPMGEDGTVQGLLELADVAYVGSGVLGSALAMDKAMAKQVLAANGIPQARYRAFAEHQRTPGLPGELAAELGLPCFVKPANMGSSVGVTKAHDVEELRDAHRARARPTTSGSSSRRPSSAGRSRSPCSAARDPRRRGAGEIVPGAEFYDYEDKYVTDGAQLLVPAPLDAASRPTRCARWPCGCSRCCAATGWPGSTSSSRRAAAGSCATRPTRCPASRRSRCTRSCGRQPACRYPELIDRLVELAIERHARRRRNTKH